MLRRRGDRVSSRFVDARPARTTIFPHLPTPALRPHVLVSSYLVFFSFVVSVFSLYYFFFFFSFSFSFIFVLFYF